MMGSIAVLFFTAAALSTEVSGLQCYWCSHNAADSSNPVLSFFLRKLSTISNEHCLLANDLDKYHVDLRNCPPPRPGYVAKCGVVEGTVTTEISFITVHFKSVERDCVEVPENDQETSDGCHDNAHNQGTVTTLLDEVFTKFETGDIEFEGDACYDTVGIEPKGLVCPRCTWNELETSHDLVEWFLDGLALLKNDHCLLEDPEDLYNVGIRECKPAGSNEMAKCGEIDGKITGNVLNIDYVYKTLQRDCVMVPTINVATVASAYTDGCHMDAAQEGPVVELVQESYGDMDVDDAKFSGKACYVREYDFNNISAASTQSALSLLVLTLASILVALWV